MEAKKYWNKYDAGTTYNATFKNNKDYYESVKVWNNFYNGDQWIGIEGSEMPELVFNIIKRICDFKVASVTSSNVAVNVEPLQYQMLSDGELSTSDFVNSEIKNIFEKWNFQSLGREALRKGCITGDIAAHIIFNPSTKPYRGAFPDIKGEIEVELLDATSVLFGNANVKSVEKQPYIIITGRDTVKNLKAEAKKYNKEDEIQKDSDTEYMSSDYADVEVEIDGDEEGKAKYIYYYEKEVKDGEPKIYVTKCTKDCVIYEHVDTGLTRYPIAFENWYSQDNTYHGRGEVEGICRNQVAINKMFAMVVYHQMMTAFPTAYYDSEVISSFSNEIGTAIELEGMNGRSISNVLGYINPADMSSYIIKVIDLAFQYTKECLGVSDASLGTINPQNTSAIIAVQKSTTVPLENVKTNYYSFVEQIVLILLDTMGNKYGTRPVVITDENGNRQMIPFDFNSLNGADLHVAVDVGDGSYYSQIVTNQTLDNLLANQMIDFIDYLERIPPDVIPKKSELIAKLKEQQAGAGVNYDVLANYMDGLPQDQQGQFQSLMQQANI